MLSSHAGDIDVESCWCGAAESCWRRCCGATWLRRDVDAESCWRQYCQVMLARCCWVMLAMVLPGWLSRDAMYVSSHVGDNAADSCWWRCGRANWPQRDLDAESCWRQCSRVMLATVLSGRLGRSTMQMSSHAGDNAAESCWWWRYQGDWAAARCICRVMLATMLSSNTCNGAASATQPRRDVDADSCWRQCCRVMLAIALSRWLGHNAM
jgi:hypothetical protein